MKKIVLVYPALRIVSKGEEGKIELESLRPWPPISLLCLGTFLKKRGYDVKVIDFRVDNSLDQLEQYKDALLVGVSIMTPQIESALKISEYVKKKFDVPVVFGGAHASLFPDQTCLNEFVDFVVVGEGEQTLLELADVLVKKGSFDKIEGLCYKKGGVVRVNPTRKNFIDLDELYPLDYELLTGLQHFINKSNSTGFPVFTSRGCPNRCDFCHNTGAGNRYRTKSIDLVIKEMKYLNEKFGISFFRFLEDNLFVSRGRVEELCKGIIKSGLRVEWGGGCRVDYFKEGHIDDDLLKLMKMSGCSNLNIGVESGSLKMLKIMKKDIIPEQAVKSAFFCKKYNIIPLYNFMIGLPDETKKDVFLTIKLIKNLEKIYPDCDRGFNIYRPYPPGKLFGRAIELSDFELPSTLEGWIDDKIYLNFLRTSLDLSHAFLKEGDKIPWNPHEKFIASVVFYQSLQNTCKKRFLKERGFVRKILEILAKIRWKLNFFYFPIERKIFKIFYYSYMNNF